MAGLFDRLRYGLLPARQAAQPYREQGVAGFVMMGGIPQSNETNHRLLGAQRWRTAADMLSNVSIVAAGLRYSLNLTARPKWKADPVNDTAEAKAAAEFVEDVISNTDRSWSRIIRTSAMYRFHGFQINEWVASKRDDGKIGIQTVEPRPQHTIERWDLDANGGVQGVWQRDPQTSKEIYLPRAKIVYLVDDQFTDRPDGMGVFRHLVEDWNQLRVYMKLERIGFQRDLTGIPIGRVPLAQVNQMVTEGKITAQQRDQMIEGIRDFVSMETKSDTTGLLLDSEAYSARTDTGETISSVMKWGIDLITGEQNSVEALGAAIKRTQFDMALVMGVSSLLTGREGEGSRALSEDQSRNLYLTVNQSLNDMAEAYDRDIVGPLWTMNGMDEKLRPKLTHEDASFKDVEQIASVLQKMAAAGAILAPDDPAINDLRNLMGVSEAEEMSIEDLGLIRSAGKPDPNEPGGANDNKPNDAPKGARERRGAAQKYSPDQWRDATGRWVDMPDKVEIDGKMRWTRNSRGQRIAKSEEELRNFYEWYGKSISYTTDTEGRPIVYFHGTIRQEMINEFNPSRAMYDSGDTINAIGTWFTNEAGVADIFAGASRPDEEPRMSGGTIYPAYLKMESPLVIDGHDFNRLWRQHAGGDERGRNGNVAKFREWMGSQGYDGLWAKADDIDPGFGKSPNSEYIVVLNSNQIKSITNTGQFGPGADIGKFNPYHRGSGPGGGQFTSAASETSGVAPEVGEPFLVYRAGSEIVRGLENRNAGNSLAVGIHLARLDDSETPKWKGQADSAALLSIHAYKVTLNKPVGPFERFNSGVGEGGYGVGFETARSASGNADAFSFSGSEGYTAEYIGSFPATAVLAELNASNPGRNYKTFDDWGGALTGEAIRSLTRRIGTAKFNPNHYPAGPRGGQFAPREAPNISYFDPAKIADILANLPKKQLLPGEAEELDDWLDELDIVGWPEWRGVGKFNPYHVPSGPQGGQFTTGPGGPVMVKDTLGNTAPVDANSSLAKFLVKNPDGSYSLDPEREKLHEQIVQHYLSGVKPTVGQPEMFMTGGGPASGKSSVLMSGTDVMLPGKYDAVHVDPDAIKFQLPEMAERLAAGDKTASSYVHEESSLVRRRLEAAAIAGNYNVVLDTTGDSSVDKLEKNLSAYRAAGYRVNAIYATNDVNLASRLAHERGIKTGRFVPDSFLRDTHRDVTRTFVAAAKERHLFDRVQLFDTNILGQPRLVATGDRQSFSVRDEALWKDFTAKGNG